MKLSVIIATLIYASSAAAYKTRIIPRHESNSDPNPEPEQLEDGQLGLGRVPWTPPTLITEPTLAMEQQDVGAQLGRHPWIDGPTLVPPPLAMERDVVAPAAPAPVAHIAPKHVPRLRGAKHVMSSDAVLDHSYESLTSLANSYRMTAQALLKTADLAMDLSTLEDLTSLEEAKGQVLRAAQVAQSLGEIAKGEADEVFESVLSIHHKASSPSTEQAFYSSKKAVRKSNHAAHKAEQKTHRATSKAEHKTQKSLNKADRKTESAIHKANYKTASALAKTEASAASSCLGAADALNHAAELAANAISNGTAATVDAAKLAAYEASNAVIVANDSLNHAAKVVINTLNW